MDAILVLDLLVFIVSVVAFLFYSLALKHVYLGKIRRVQCWSLAAVFFLLMRKVFDVLGEYVFTANNPFWNSLEDVAFLLGMLSLMYAGKVAQEFFESIDFRTSK